MWSRSAPFVQSQFTARSLLPRSTIFIISFAHSSTFYQTLQSKLYSEASPTWETPWTHYPWNLGANNRQAAWDPLARRKWHFWEIAIKDTVTSLVFRSLFVHDWTTRRPSWVESRRGWTTRSRKNSKLALWKLKRLCFCGWKTWSLAGLQSSELHAGNCRLRILLLRKKYCKLLYLILILQLLFRSWLADNLLVVF